MTLFEITKNIETIASTQHSVKIVGDGDIYKLMNACPNIQYAVFFVTQNNHKRINDFDYYSFNLFYIDRLLPNLESNALEIQSIGKEVIQNVIQLFCDNYESEVTQNISYVPFVERFQDECAGIYATVEFVVAVDNTCAE